MFPETPREVFNKLRRPILVIRDPSLLNARGCKQPAGPDPRFVVPAVIQNHRVARPAGPGVRHCEIVGGCLAQSLQYAPLRWRHRDLAHLHFYDSPAQIRARSILTSIGIPFRCIKEPHQAGDDKKPRIRVFLAEQHEIAPGVNRHEPRPRRAVVAYATPARLTVLPHRERLLRWHGAIVCRSRWIREGKPAVVADFFELGLVEPPGTILELEPS